MTPKSMHSAVNNAHRAAVALAAGLCLQAGAWENDATRAIVPPDEIMTVEIAADTVWDKPVFVDGVLRKTGTGTLTLTGEKLYGHGRIEVAAGELAVTATGAGSAAIAEPTSILAGAAMWLDATRHVAGTDGAAATVAAKTWYDVREENWATVGAARSYIYAEGRDDLATGGLLPSPGADEAGRAFIDFGGFKSGQYMAWCKPTGASASIPVFNSFVAYNPHGEHGHLLGTVSATVYFETARDRFFVTSANNPANRNHIRNGRVFCNGERVAASDLIDTNAVQVVETESYPGGKNADAFFNYRSYQQSAGSYSNGDRVGGGRLHEVVVFTNQVAEADRVLVAHYLLRKWVNTSGYGALPAFSVARGASLDIDSAVAAATTVESEGSAKIGGAIVSLTSKSLTDPYAGLGGTLETDAGAAVSNLVGAAIAAAAGTIYDSDAFNTVTATAGTAGEVRKTGDGSLAMAGIGNATSLVVAGGIASLRAVPEGADAVPSENCIADGRFEGDYAGTGTKTYSNGASIGAWVVTNYNTSSGSTRVLKSTYASGAFVAAAKPEGCSNYLFLKQGGGVRQTVNLPKSGRYEVTLRFAPRNATAGFARIYIDDILVGTAQSPASQKKWDALRFETPWIEAGTHAFTISSEVTVDVACGIYDVQMCYLDGLRAVVLPNANLEDADWVEGSNALLPDEANAHYRINYTINTNAVLPSVFLTKWIPSGTVELLRSLPYLRSNANFEAPVTGTGSIAAFLGNGASLSQTVTVPADGIYRLGALATCYNKSGNSATQTGGSLVLSLGSASETITLDNWSPKRVGMVSGVRLQAGDMVSVSIAAENTSGDNNLLVDDVRLVRMDNLVANPGFEEGGANIRSPSGWTVVANPLNRTLLFRSDDETSAAKVSTWGRSFVDGIYRLCLGEGRHLAQTIPLQAGLYRLSFWNVTRCFDLSGPRAPAPILVTLASGTSTNLCATVVPSASSREMARREFLVGIGASGDWTLGFEALDNGDDEELVSFIDAVCLVPATDLAADALPATGEKPAVVVSSGARLGLDWTGILEAETVKCAGQSLVGDVTAASAPDSLYGIGAFNVKPKATTVIIR